MIIKRILVYRVQKIVSSVQVLGVVLVSLGFIKQTMGHVASAWSIVFSVLTLPFVMSVILVSTLTLIQIHVQLYQMVSVLSTKLVMVRKLNVLEDVVIVQLLIHVLFVKMATI